MVIGVLTIDLSIPEAMSLKDKRRSVKSLKARLGSRPTISIAEVGYLEDHRRSLIAMAMVSTDRRFAESCLCKIVDEVRRIRSVDLVDYELDWF